MHTTAERDAVSHLQSPGLTIKNYFKVQYICTIATLNPVQTLFHMQYPPNSFISQKNTLYHVIRALQCRLFANDTMPHTSTISYHNAPSLFSGGRGRYPNCTVYAALHEILYLT
jgi:hypothetical protein